MKQNHLPEYLYKIVSPEQWQESLIQNRVMPSAIDTTFIHLATEGQIEHVAQKFWRNRKSIILKLAANRLLGNLVYENNPGGSNYYYHLYSGSIPLDAVVEIVER